MGACLEQWIDNQWKPLAFWSKQLKPNEQKWSCFKRELYAIQQALRHFMVEVDGRHVTVLTDHLPIVGAFKNQNALNHDPIARAHLLEISNWTNDIRYLKGASNLVADLLSRPSQDLLGNVNKDPPHPFDSGTQNMPDAPVSALLPTIGAVNLQTLDYQALAAAQAQCPEVARHRAGHQADGLVMADIEFIPGVHLYCDTAGGKKARPLLPEPHRKLIMNLFHQINHPGVRETVSSVNFHYRFIDI